MKTLQISSLSLVLMVATPVNAQVSKDAEPNTPAATSTEYNYVDEIIAIGQKAPSNHPGMRAFFDGDFVKAEISFEREFLKLKRDITTRENAAFQATNSRIRTENLSNTTSATSSSANTSSNVNSSSSSQANSAINLNLRNNLKDKGKPSRGIFTDGKVNDDDFSFSKYMAGLSQLQLGKFDEAEKSFKTSLFFDSKNYDARLRLGLLHLRNRDYEKAAKQLEKIDKIRGKCVKKKCDDRKFINDAAFELATEITKIAKSQNQK